MFEHALIESAKHHAPNKTILEIVPLVIIIHAIVLAGVVAAQYWTIEDVPEPPIQVSFFQAAAPPPPAWRDSAGARLIR